jgi:Nif-specific regulatory protein
MALLCRHPWPGNVRELENAIERAVVLGKGPEIVAGDLGLKTSDEAAPTAAAGIVPFHASVDAFKNDLIRRALDRAKGSQTRAAELLGVQRTYLARLIKTFALREETS